MQESKRAELTARLKEVLKEHQRDGDRNNIHCRNHYVKSVTVA